MSPRQRPRTLEEMADFTEEELRMFPRNSSSASQSQRQKTGKRSKLDIGDIADSMEKVRAADQIITINPDQTE